MLKKISGKPNDQVQEGEIEREIVVSSVNQSKKANHIVSDEAGIEKEYRDEVKVKGQINLMQGLSAGAGVGLIVSTLAVFIGVTLSVGDIVALISIPAVLGVIAGYIFS